MSYPRQFIAGLTCAALLFVAAPAVSPAAETLRLDALIARAEAANPGAAAMRARYEASRERIPRAGALEDPMLMTGFMAVEVDNFAFDRIPMTTKDIGISQKIPFYGKRGLREDAARYESEAVEAEYREKLLDVRAEVKKAYFELWYIKKAQETVDKNMALAGSLREVAQTRYSVGKGPFGDVLKAQLEETGLVDRKLELRKDERTMRAMLGALTGSDMPSEGEVEDIATANVEIDKDALVSRATGNRPAIQAADARVRKGGKMVELARKDYYPDFEAAFTYSQTERLADGMYQSDRISGQLKFNLPVWWSTKLGPGVREAASERAMAESERESGITEIMYRVDSILGEVEQAERTMKLYRDIAVPQATESLDALLAGYEVGRSDFMALVDARRMLYDYELGYYKAMAGREKSVAELEAVTGGF